MKEKSQDKERTGATAVGVAVHDGTPSRILKGARSCIDCTSDYLVECSRRIISTGGLSCGTDRERSSTSVRAKVTEPIRLSEGSLLDDSCRLKLSHRVFTVFGRFLSLGRGDLLCPH